MYTKIKSIIAFFAITFGFFMAMLDSTIVNIALPKMTYYFNCNIEKITWIVNGYNIAFSVFIITASKIADQFGRKKLFITGLSIFVITSFAVGYTTSIDVLILIRVLQGLSAAIVVPVTIPIVVNMYPPHKHGLILGIWAAISGLAAASGPTVGGILTERFNWQSVFYVNIPIGIIAIMLTAFLIEESYDPTASKCIDWKGIILLSVSIFTLTFGMIQMTGNSWSPRFIESILFIGVLSLVIFAIAELKVKEPMLPIWLLKIWTFDAGTLTLLIVSISSMGTIFLLSFFLIQVKGMTAIQAGLLISAMPLSTMVGSLIGGPLSSKYGSRWFVVMGVVLIALSIYSLGDLNEFSNKTDIILRISLIGIGLGLSVTPTMGAAVRNVPVEKVGIVSGIINMSRSLGTVIGVAIMVTVLNSNLTSEISLLKSKIIETVVSDQVLDYKTKQFVEEKISLIKLEVSNEKSSAFKMENTLEELKKYEEKTLLKTPTEKKMK